MRTDHVASFVGRVDELSALDALRRESHRHGRFVLVAAEPGLGKSHLVKQFLTTSQRGRSSVGIGHALEHIRSPFEPWISALQNAVPSAAQALRPNGGAFEGKAEMYRSVIEALRIAAGRRSTILALEDLHWADCGSVELLHLLAAEISSFPRLLVIGTLRASEADDSLRHLLTRPETRVLELDRLAAAETLELVRSITGENSERCAQIAHLSGGNPFFAIELAKGAARDGIPLTLRTAIDSRLEHLGTETFAYLEAAAVLGEAFELELLGDIFGVPPADVADGLHEAQRARIVIEESAGRFRFSHALTRAVLAERITSAQRIRLHQRAAVALEERKRFDARGFAELAYHYGGAHDHAKAYAYQMRAGGLAYNVHAYTDATRFFSDAAASAPRGSLEQARALARHGDALFRVPALADSERVYLEAIEIFRIAGATEDAARIYQSLATSLFNQDRMRDALTFLERAFTELGALPVDVSDELALQAAMQAMEMDPKLGQRWLDRVDESRVAATTRGGRYYALQAAAAATLGDADAFSRNTENFAKNVQTVQLNPHYVGHFGNLAANSLFLGLPAMHLYDQCFSLARSLKLDVYEAAFASHAAYERWLHGDEEGFIRFADFARDRDIPIPALHAYVLLASLLRNETLPASKEIEALIAGGHNEFFGPLAGTFARRAAETGNVRLARRILDAAADRLNHPYAAWETLTALAEFGSARGRARAEALIAPHINGPAPAFAATANMVRALGCARDGDVEARDLFATRAEEWYRRCGWVHHERRARQIALPHARGPSLSQRELQIAGLLQSGHSNREMASQLFISEKTVEKHVARLYEKLDVNNRAAAVRALTQRLPE